MAHLLGCENVHLEYPSKRVFDSVTLGVDEGDRIGVVGANGDGKSTLLALLAGSVKPDGGRVVARSGLRIGALWQADSLEPSQTVAHAVVGDVPEHTWASDARVRGIIRDLIADIPWDGVVGELSGGQRRRVDLARVLVHDFDVLMLDEPTNHLDVRGITWLAEHLKTRWPKKSGALLVVTHDRWFLDEVCLGMWEVHDGQVDRFEGGYSAYVLQRVERAEAARVTEQKRKNLMRKELAWLARAPQARGTKPKFRVDAANALIADEPPMRNSLELKRSAISRLGKQVVDLLHVSERFAEKTVIDDVTWHIGPGDRFGILGENGSGKTTLLRIIQGELAPTTGEVRIGQTVKFAVLSQHLAELNELAKLRVREVLGRYNTRYEIDGREISPSQLLERLGFENAHLSAFVSTLSGGQKRRLQLMLILLDRPNALILDEPDNDLDTDMLALVESLLDTWPGTLLLITHDRHLMERVTDDQFALIDGHVRHVPGGVDEYLRLIEQRDARRAEEPARPPTTSATTAETPALPRAEEYALKKQLASTERKLETLGKKVEEARRALYDVDPSDYEALLDGQARVEDLERQLGELEDEWMRISERLS
jgi:ATPase subunit of ABC transporter with duplicated ATPase domains